jgi:hypothetical protein
MCQSIVLHFWSSPYLKLGAVVIVWLLDLQVPVQSVPITNKVVSSNPVYMYHCRTFSTIFYLYRGGQF